MTSGAAQNVGQSSPPSQPILSTSTPASPPSKRDLKSWWKNFKLPSKQQDTQHDNRGPGIFGVPLRTSITYANVAISLVDEEGQSYIYGYVPIVVAKCGVFLKEKATGIEGIFRLSGSEKRIKELKTIFDSPDRYGKGLVWEGYTVHDAANVLRRYLNDLPEPVVPLDLYEKFRDPLRGATKQAVGDAEGPQFVDNFNERAAIDKYQTLITELPPLNKQLLLYILDLLAVFAAKSDENRMTSQNLAAIFQPGMLSHPAHAMAPDEYRLNQCVIIFLIENQDHFLIGMQGTAADETTMKEVASGTPNGPLTPNPNRKSGLGRTASNSSAGAESVRRDGKLRRNRSVSSRHSKADGSVTPNSPSLTTTPTGGLGRSNTVPSKKSPALVGGKFKKHESPGRAPHSPALEPLTQAHPDEESLVIPDGSDRAHSRGSASNLSPQPGTLSGRSQERLLDVPHEVSTPPKDRNLHNLFQRSPHESGDKKPPNKLKKKRIPGSMSLSAQSSCASLPHSHSNNASPGVEAPNPLESPPHVSQPQAHPIPHSLLNHSCHSTSHTPPQSAPQPAEQEQQAESHTPLSQPNYDGPADSSHRHSQVLSHNSLRPEDISRGKKSPPQSLHSSFNEGSDMDQVIEELPVPVPTEHTEKEKKSRWRISRSKKEDFAGFTGSPLMTPPHMNIGTNYNAEISTTSIGSALNKPRKSFTGDSSEHLSLSGERVVSHESGRDSFKDDSKGPISWIKSKYREAKENAEQRRAKSPPPAETHQPFGPMILAPRGKSLDIKRDTPREEIKRTLREVPREEPVEAPKPTPPVAQVNQEGHRETPPAELVSKEAVKSEQIPQEPEKSETIPAEVASKDAAPEEAVAPHETETEKAAAVPPQAAVPQQQATPPSEEPQQQSPAPATESLPQEQLTETTK